MRSEGGGCPARRERGLLIELTAMQSWLMEMPRSADPTRCASGGEHQEVLEFFEPKQRRRLILDSDSAVGGTEISGHLESSACMVSYAVASSDAYEKPRVSAPEAPRADWLSVSIGAVFCRRRRQTVPRFHR